MRTSRPLSDWPRGRSAPRCPARADAWSRPTGPRKGGPMPHLDTGLIHALLDGEIPSTELPPLQSHLARCAECRGRVDTERALLEEAVVLIDQLQISDSRRR